MQFTFQEVGKSFPNIQVAPFDLWSDLEKVIHILSK